MTRIARFAADHARWVFAACVVLVLAGATAASGLSGALSQSFALPGQPGYEANQRIAALYHGGGETAPTVLAIHLPGGANATSPAIVADLDRGRTALTTSLASRGGSSERARPAPRVIVYRGGQDRALVSADRRTTYALIFTHSSGGFDAPVLGQSVARRFLARSGLPRGTSVQTTGVDELSSAGSSGGSSSILVETLIGGAGALIVLVFVFGSFLAVLPLLCAVVSILTTFILVRGLTLVTDVSAIVEFLVALIGLGVAIDYSLLIVTRWREERANGLDNRAAVLQAARTAGHSVVFSGVTVAIGLLALIVLPVPFLRSVGYGGVLIPLVSIAVSLTLVPALLMTAGPFLDRPRRRRARPASAASRGWTWWARTVIRFRWPAAILGVGLLAALAVCALSLRVGDPETSALQSSGPATTALRTLERAHISSGALTPIEVLATPRTARRVRERATTAPGVRGVVQTGQTATTALLDVIPEQETSGSAGQRTLDRLKSRLAAERVSIGGPGANSEAFNDAVYGSFPLMLGIIAAVTLILLTRVFRSILLSFKAVVLNLLSVGATYGLLTLVWQDGHGSDAIWGVPATGAITNFVPLMVFAFLFGLSMDYEVFLLARMRESFDEHGSTSRAIVDGLGRTGKLITSAALILFLSFLSLSQTPNVDLKIFATALGGGILLDAIVVRGLIAPTLIALVGRWNWWLPTRIARALLVEPSPMSAIRQPVADGHPRTTGSEGRPLQSHVP